MKKLSEHRRMNNRILLLNGHPGLFLLKCDFSPQRLLLTLRSAPCHHHPELLAKLVVITRSMTETLFNVHFDDNSWPQAKLPVRYGGHGLRIVADLALPAFLSSRMAGKSLVNDSQRTRHWTTMRFGLGWMEISHYLPTLISKEILCSSAVATLVTVLNQHRLACFKAVSRPEFGAWLKLVLYNRVCTFIDNDTLRVGLSA